MRRLFGSSLRLAPVLLAFAADALAAEHSATSMTGERQVAARTMPVPLHVSAELQSAIRSAAKQGSDLLAVPQSPDEWRAKIAEWERPNEVHARVAALIKKFPVTVTAGRMAGVQTYVVMPAARNPEYRSRVIVHVHGGGYVSGAGEAVLDEAVLLAHYTQTKVVAVDYRMPPDHPFPAALDDAIAVWKQITSTTPPSNAAIGGSSAGGGLTLAMVLRLKELHAPLPEALFAGTPWADLTNSGDSTKTNDGIDGALSGGGNEFLLAAGRLYAGAEEVRNPLISPVYGSFAGFPPTILVTGTRDFLLSDTVRVHRKLRAAGIEAELHVFEAMSHADYATITDAPESREAYEEVAAFFDRHLGR